MTGPNSLIAKKRADLASKIPPQWRLPTPVLSSISESSDISAFALLKQHGWLSQRETELTESFTAQELCQHIALGKTTAVEVCRAFCHRAAIAQQLTNCATEIFFGEALERARYLDDYFAKEGKLMGPFHGLPISVKDSFNIKGQSTTIGFVSHLALPASVENSPLIDLLLEKGAIMYIKTNVPQTMMTLDSVNNVFGRTLNPHRLCLTAGGSSGGEGALVGFRGSILGVGTDVGGSIRVPSMCNGTYGFKPTTNRIPYSGQRSAARAGSPGIVAAAGPLSQSAADLTFFTREVLLSRPWTRDPSAVGAAWRQVQQKPTLTIGVYIEDPAYPLTPLIRQTLRAAAEKLSLEGHNVEIVTDFPPLLDAARIASRLWMLDNEKTAMKHIKAGGEEPIAALAYAAPTNLVEDRLYTLDDVWESNAQLADYRNRVFKVWKDLDLDVLMCPVAQTPAVAHDTFGMPIYTVAWNLLDFPASVIPSIEEGLGSNAGPMDAPCGLQIVGWRFQDEEVLAATETIDMALRA